jgi:hypothetical protein
MQAMEEATSPAMGFSKDFAPMKKKVAQGIDA